MLFCDVGELVRERVGGITSATIREATLHDVKTDKVDLHDVKADEVDLHNVKADEVDLHDVKADEVDLHDAKAKVTCAPTVLGLN